MGSHLDKAPRPSISNAICHPILFVSSTNYFQIARRQHYLLLTLTQVRRDLVEETLVEEFEEGELAHISWVSSYDRPLPQVGLVALQKITPDVI